MKKVLIKLSIVLIIICSFIITNNNISYGASNYLIGYLYQNNEHIFKDIVTDDSLLDERNLRSEWVSAVYDMVRYVNNRCGNAMSELGYNAVKTENDITPIETALNLLTQVSATYFHNDTEAWKKLSEVSGGTYGATAKGVEEFCKSEVIYAQCALRAAYDSINGTPSDVGDIAIEDDAETKFKYNLNQIKKYYNRYCYSGVSDTVKKVWIYKNGQNSSDSIATRKNIFVEVKDSADTKKNYDSDQIKIYLAAYGEPNTKQHSSKEVKEIKEKWEKTLGKDVESALSDIYKSGNELENTSVASQTSDNVTYSDKTPDKDLGIAFQQPERIEAKRRGRNSRCCK